MQDGGGQAAPDGRVDAGREADQGRGLVLNVARRQRHHLNAATGELTQINQLMVFFLQKSVFSSKFKVPTTSEEGLKLECRVQGGGGDGLKDTWKLKIHREFENN